MQFNDALITHYREGIIPLYTLRGLVELNDAYLKEKPTWYVINREVKYFKVRGDLRLFSELFFTEFARDIIGLDTLDYEVAHVRTLDAKVKPSQEERKTGLLSTNFQTKDNNYYLVSELYDPEICGLTGYGNYNLQNLLSFFRDGVASEDYKNIESFLTKLFLADAFTLQVDRNPNNIGFQIPKIPGVKYTQRLRPEILARLGKAEGNVVLEKTVAKITGLVPSKVYDSERIFGIDHKNEFVHKKGDVWAPLFPFNDDLLFKDQDVAQETQEVYDGLDPNLFELLDNYPQVRPIAERLAYDDEYKRILEQFKGTSKPVSLSDSEIERIGDTVEERREVFRKVLSL
ncbi:MAG: hypothetical protein IKQ35_00305 [Bacilli bacterium]|nr:hypothetical protein [Bacilli bacterium]